MAMSSMLLILDFVPKVPDQQLSYGRCGTIQVPAKPRGNVLQPKLHPNKSFLAVTRARHPSFLPSQVVICWKPKLLQAITQHLHLNTPSFLMCQYPRKMALPSSTLASG